MHDNDVKADDIIQTDDLSSLGELAAVDSIIAEAVEATDKGDYRAALDGFEHALEVTQRIFGDNIKLTELKCRITEINELLNDQKAEADAD